MRANRPVASAKAKPRTAYEKSWPAGTRHVSGGSPRANWRSMLTSEGGVASNTLDESAEDASDTDTSTSEAHGGETGTLHLGGGQDGSGRGLDDDTALLHGVADHVVGEVVACAIEEETAAGSSRLASSGEDGAGDASWTEVQNK
jgi:hypothetical protein